MTKYQAVDSTGRVHKRGTKNRTYTHCVVAYHTVGSDSPLVSWAGSPELAELRANTFRNYRRYGDPTQPSFESVEIVEAKEV